MNVDRAIYGQGRFRSFPFLEMWQWYSLRKNLQADPQAGTAQERKMAQEANCSVRQWLVMKEEDIITKSLKRFRRYILDKENPPQDRTPPAAAASSSSSGSKGDRVCADDALLLETLASFEGEGDAGGRKKTLKTKARSDPPQKPHTYSVSSSAAPASAPGVDHGMTYNVTDADVTCAAIRPSTARSTLYKRKRSERSGVGPPAELKVYICALGGQSTQGHLKYRKKTYCESTKSSTSKGLAKQTFANFADFKKAVDNVLDSQSQPLESV
ncbi:uncharacterized protein LOC130553424 [Triplophysa rosa]|nr:uncharacterized protein LOC130553424 [Triplophysa rosa]